MSNFKGDYLRVLTPITTNGTVPAIGLDGRPMYKESHLDLRAQKHLEKKNKRLPVHLRHIIERVSAGVYKPQIQPVHLENAELKRQIEELKAKQSGSEDDGEAEEKPAGRRGRPAKTVDNE